MRSVERFLKSVLLRIVTSVRSLFVSPPQQLSPDSIRKILIIRQHDQLGDLLLATPSIRAVRRRFPGAFVAVVVREYTAPVLEHNPHVDEVIVFYEKLWRWNLRRAARFYRQVRAGFDCAIVLNTISRSVTSDFIALLSGARWIVGPDHLPMGGSGKEMIYNVPAHRSCEPLHEIARNLEVVSVLGARENDFEYDLVLTDKEVEQAEETFAALGMASGERIVGVHFGALNPFKCFPLEKLAEVIDWIVERYGCEVLLITGPKELERREYLLSRLHHRVSTAPLMPLRVMAALLRHCAILLCNDTGILHVAASQRVPTVSFHSLSDPEIWKPPHDRHVAVRASDARIESITVEQVEQAFTRLWSKVVET
ncbi:MAG TPA: glycosyltransferase family 9 protein [Bacteroidota bacterium]|nr:glycosyltransferase family 9 protein [Bacteroidota bacterium]